MNLLKDPWLPIIRKNGDRSKIGIHELLKNYSHNPVINFEAPRPDFRCAIAQLLIGIVQVSAMPKSEKEWGVLFNKPYRGKEFSERILKYKECFGISNFMQDFELKAGDDKSISNLLMETPGKLTIKKNLDFFNKRNKVKQIDAYWATIALYTLQTFASSGGAGHRVGLRGGGPLTTIIIPGKDSTLWERIWVNVISDASLIMGNVKLKNKADIFPWMKPSKLSNSKGSELTAEEVHPFHHFFGMPRRIKLGPLSKGLCDITGEMSDNLIKTFTTINYGNNYSGEWQHPLSAHFKPKKPGEIPLTMKGQPYGVNYRHWAGLTLETKHSTPAIIVKLYNSNIREKICAKRNSTLWVSGYDMDQMKARCWYDSTMPLYPFEPKEMAKIATFAKAAVTQVIEISGSLRIAIKSAWYKSPKDVKGNFGENSFWQNSEHTFYSMLKNVLKDFKNKTLKKELVEEWGRALKKEANNIFDMKITSQQKSSKGMKRAVMARLILLGSINRINKKHNGSKSGAKNDKRKT